MLTVPACHIAIALAVTFSLAVLPVSLHSTATDHGPLFCFVNDFSASRLFYHPVPNATSATGHVPAASVAGYIDSGLPFVVSGVTDCWPATSRWSHSYFQTMFSGHTLFSSTFSTTKLPTFTDGYPNKEVYYGIFLNDARLAALVAKDYDYPRFIPEELRVHGNEWVHWGYPPCGAKRHMDLTCTSRISVQVSGRKKWRLYPVADGGTAWSKVLRPLEVTLGPGDALVWFPGWEHETRIESGPSISLSLHFLSSPASHYIQTFQDTLSSHVSSSCNWGHI